MAALLWLDLMQVPSAYRADAQTQGARRQMLQSETNVNKDVGG
jgi:hypothetical protein